jgi:hypothetical protein
MIVGRVVKQPAEQFPVSIDFSPRILAGDAVDSATVTAVNRATGADATSEVLTGSVGITGNIVSRVARAGAHGVQYVLTFRATTDDGHIYEDEILMTVKEQS